MAGHILQYLLAILFGAIMLFATPFIVVALPTVYERLGIYHYLRRNASQNGIHPDRTEPFWKKVLLVSKFNFAALLFTIGLLAPYQTKIFGIQLSPTAIFVIAMFTVILHSSLRLAAFLKVGYIDPNNTEHICRIRDRSLGFGYSFLMSLYFLMMVSVGVGLANGTIDTTVLVQQGKISLIKPLAFLLLTIVSVFTFSLVGEYILMKWEVHDDLKDPLPSSRL